MNRCHFAAVVLKNEGIRLEYFILSENREDVFGQIRTSYGVEIVQAPLNTCSCSPYLRRAVPDLCESYEEIRTFAKELCESLTDPVCLEDIAADVFG